MRGHGREGGGGGGEGVNRRNLMVMGGYGVMLTLLGGRLYWLQIKEGDKYKRLGERNRIGIRLLSPERGLVTDRLGRELALNYPVVRISVIPREAPDLEGVLRSLSDYLVLGSDRIGALLEKARGRPSFLPLLIADKVSWEEVAQIAVRVHEMPGVQIEGGFRRDYPYGSLFAHVLGYTGHMDLSRGGEESLYARLPSPRVGKSGMERVLDSSLRGQVGIRQVESNALGRVVREIGREESKTGEKVRLTLDVDLQRFLHFQMRKVRAGGAMLIDPWTGSVRAMVSKPDFDPNIFSRDLSVSEWEDFRRRRPSPLLNRVTGQSYAPGSLFKLVMMLSAMEAGIPVGRRYLCEGSIEVGQDRLHCWKKGGHGRLNMEEALRSSCDVWFYRVMEDLGLERAMETARKLGFGEKVGDDHFLFERTGLLPSRAWKEERFGSSWTLGDSLVVGIGQGYVSGTLAQMGMMMSRLLTGGVTRNLRLLEADSESVKSELSGDELYRSGYFGGKREEDESYVSIDPLHRRVILRATDQVVNDKRGTAYRLRLRYPGLSFAGKTGTSQVRRISAAEREEGVKKNEDLPWRLRDHSLFAGYAPLDLPRYVMVVLIEHGGSSTRAAVPIAREMLLRTQIGFDQGIDT